MKSITSREEIIQICDHHVLKKSCDLYGINKQLIKKIPEYEGSANLIYEFVINNKPMILRVSYTPERSHDQIKAELHFVNYLSEHGVRVSIPVPSKNGNLVESIHAAGIAFHIVSFIRGKGIRVPDNGYRYRDDAPIDEYFQNWGRILGQMHALSKKYQPASADLTRPDWFNLHKNRISSTSLLPVRLKTTREKILDLLNELNSLPRSDESFGLIHGDFNDGNFTVDYSKGDITVFDFDDSCHFWFIYELASAWEGGLGRVMFSGLEERSAFMKHYMEQVMEGYQRENSLPADWLDRLPMFIKLIQVEEFLHYSQYLENADEKMQRKLNYLINCIENDIPYMGFFDDIYSPDIPFSL